MTRARTVMVITTRVDLTFHHARITRSRYGCVYTIISRRRDLLSSRQWIDTCIFIEPVFKSDLDFPSEAGVLFKRMKARAWFTNAATVRGPVLRMACASGAFAAGIFFTGYSYW